MSIISNTKNKLSNSFPALTHKNYRYFWFGQCVSLIGTWMQTTTQGWLVLKITEKNTSFLLGLLNAVQFTPLMIFSLFAGVIVDKFSKKKILLFTQSALMIVALTQSILVWTGVIKYWHLIIIAFMLGIINTIDLPTRQSFVIELVGKKDLMNAIALNSSIFNAARILGPSIAGISIAYLGVGYGFFANAISFIPVIYGISKIKVHNNKKLKSDNKILTEIKDGLKYISKNFTLISTFALITIMGIFAFNYNVLIPIFSVNVLKLDSKGYGFLMSALGMGSLFGALTMAFRSKGGPKKIVLNGGGFVVCSLLIIIGCTKVYYLTALFLAVVGCFNVIFSTTANSTVQLNTEDKFRGRVMSVYSLLFTGVTPIGSLFTGAVTNNFGAAKGFIYSGIFSIILLSIITIITLRKNKKIPLKNL